MDTLINDEYTGSYFGDFYYGVIGLGFNSVLYGYGENLENLWSNSGELGDNCNLYLNIDENKISSPEVTCYPNPATGEFYVQSSEKIADLKIYSMGWHQMYEVISNQTNHFQNKLDLSSLSSGIYLVQITFEDGTVMRQLVTKV